MSNPEFISLDDMVMPFAVEPLNVRGRAIRLHQVVNTVLKAHNYPAPVARLLGEALCLAGLLGSSLKFEGQFILQLQGDGPVSLMIADFRTPNTLRGYARFDAARVAELEEAGFDLSDLTGQGALVLTIDQGADMARYQGVVPLEGMSLADAAHTYFRQSEQIPTLIKLSVGEEKLKGEEGTHWRAAGMMVQHLPEGGNAPRDLHGGDGAEELESFEADEWREAEALFGTIEDYELLDNTLSSEALLYRLFHERGVKVFEPTAMAFLCQCSRERIEDMLRQFSNEDVDAMIEDHKVGVTCEFCNSHYSFDEAQIEALKNS